MRQFVSLAHLIIYLQVLAAPAWGAEPRSIVLCHELLNPLGLSAPTPCPSTNCRKVYELFDKGVDHEASSFAYVGITQHQLGELLANGQVVASETTLFVRATDDHPEGRKLLRLKLSQEELDEDPARFGRKRAADYSAKDATEKSALEIVLGRLQVLSGRQIPYDPSFLRVLPDVIHSLLNLDFSGLRGREAKIEIRDVLDALSLTDIPVQEPMYAPEIEPGETSLLINAGGDYEFLVRHQRLNIFARWMGLSAIGAHNHNSPEADQIVGLFSGLPKNEGYVLALKGQVGRRVRADSGLGLQLDRVHLADIVSIEPVSERSFRFLRSLR